MSGKSESAGNSESKKNTVPKYAFYLGCATPLRERAYEISARRVLKELGVKLVEMKGANCCGLPIDAVNHEMTLALSARNLTIAEKKGLDILTLCSGCTGQLMKTNKHLKGNRKSRERVNSYLKTIRTEFQGTIEVKHLLRVFVEDIGFEKLKTYIKRPLSGMRIAAHYGCHLLMPSKYLEFDDFEDPEFLREFIALLGAEPVRYADEKQCCGAVIAGVNLNLPLNLIADKFRNVKNAQADAMTTICPSCHLMYDQHQSSAEKMFDETYNMPVLHFTQLLGLAMGIPAEELALDELKVKPEGFLIAMEQTV